jgi:thiol-disulfide isomerase/thioredoxin
MKFYLLLFSIFMSISFQSSAQKTYEVLSDSADNNSKMLKGIISKEDISNDPSFEWYAESRKIYPRPDTAAIAAFRNNKDKIYFIVFCGTWCEDTHYVLPKFFKIQEVSGFPENRIALFAVDRNKNTTGNIQAALNVIVVPTIIIMKDGKEMGRVVEYGKTGHWDKELADIINQ